MTRRRKPNTLEGGARGVLHCVVFLWCYFDCIFGPTLKILQGFVGWGRPCTPSYDICCVSKFFENLHRNKLAKLGDAIPISNPGRIH